jgi:branched-subunit amino acid aminotransferase/4-amino-4-deoxychorismate lyase
LSYHKIAVLNGHFMPVRAVRLNPTGSGVLSGWAIFTTVRIYDGFPFNVDAHVSRLRKDAGRANIPLSPGIENLGLDLTDLARRNNVGDGRARVMLLGGTGEPGKPASNLLLLTADLDERPASESVWISPYRSCTRSALLGVKLASNTLYLQSRREAPKNRFDEALVLNEREEVVEVASGNLFFVRDARVFTPSTETGCLDGTSRGVVKRLVEQLEIPLDEGRFSLDDLLSADEVFIASVSREVGPVHLIGERDFAPVPGPVTSRLQDAFRRHVQAWVAEARTAADARAEAEAETRADVEDVGDG